MTADLPDQALELRSLVTSQSTLELSLRDVPVPKPAANEVLVRVEPSPINPSDLGVLVPGADLTTASVAGTPERPIVTAPLGAKVLDALSARVDQSLPVGDEGAGTVVAAGSSSAAQALLGKVVGIAGGAMYAQYRAVDASACLVLPEGATAKDGASSFVNPLTALGMLETMRHEGHSALVHTAAASNLGQMLVELCGEDDVPLVNIVRKPDQEELLRSLGAVHVCNSASPSFEADLTEALAATSATIAFDATGGGTLASQILNGMEKAANSTAAEYSRYGSTVHKQVYIYGGLDTESNDPRQKLRYGVGYRRVAAHLLPAERRRRDHRTAPNRVAAELTTTFASAYTREVSLAGMLRPDAFNAYVKRATGRNSSSRRKRSHSCSAVGAPGPNGVAAPDPPVLASAGRQWKGNGLL